MWSIILLMSLIYEHSHKKRKDSLEGRLDRVLLAAEHESLKILVPRPSQNTKNVDIDCAGKSKQLYSLCFLENINLFLIDYAGVKHAICDCYSSRTGGNRRLTLKENNCCSYCSR